MALDDFDDEDELEDLDEGFSEAVAELDSFDEDESAALDEDLFDFPPPHEAREFDYSKHHSGVMQGSSGVERAEPPAPLPDPSGAPAKDGASAENVGELLSSPRAKSGVPSGSDAANHDLSPLSPRSPYFDAAVDADLFDFPDVFAGSRETLAVQPATDLPPARPLDPLGLGLERGKARPEEPAPTSPEVNRGAKPAEKHTPFTGEVDLAAGPLTVAPPTLYTAALPSTARGRLLEVLALAFLVLNTGLVLFAWQANSSFHDTLESVTRTVSEALAAGQGTREVTVVRPPVAGPAPTLDEAPSALTDYSLESLEAARELLAAGRYMDARKRLYRLLASADAAGLEPRVATEAEFLIAESYELQGRALAEENQ